MSEIQARVKRKTPDELFADAMSGIKSDFGNNKEARTAELAVCEMHRRLKLAARNNPEIYLMGRDESRSAIAEREQHEFWDREE